MSINTIYSSRNISHNRKRNNIFHIFFNPLLLANIHNVASLASRSCNIIIIII